MRFGIMGKYYGNAHKVCFFELNFYSSSRAKAIYLFSKSEKLVFIFNFFKDLSGAEEVYTTKTITLYVVLFNNRKFSFLLFTEKKKL